MPKTKSIKKLRAAFKATTGSKSGKAALRKNEGTVRSLDKASKKTKRIAKLNGFSVLDKKKIETKMRDVIQTTKLLSELEARVRESNTGDQIKASAAAGAGKNKSNKFLATTAIRENERMKLVAANPTFQANPLEEAHKHLAQMLANKGKGKGNRVGKFQ